MSYDVMMLKFKGARPESPEEIEPEGLAPLGAAADVRRQISNVLDGTDWSDPPWGRFEGDGFSIEFNVGADDPIDSMMLHLRGGGDAIATVAKLAAQIGWAAIDCQTDAFIDLEAPSEEGWEKWQGFRDRVVGERGGSDDES